MGDSCVSGAATAILKTNTHGICHHPERLKKCAPAACWWWFDDEDRENEGDLTMAAQFVTPESITSWPCTGAG